MSRCVEFGGLWIDFLKIKFEKNLAAISSKIFPPFYLSVTPITDSSCHLVSSHRLQYSFSFYSISFPSL